jgi:hypothetical protein
MGPAAVFPLWGVLMEDCVGEMAVYEPAAVFPSWGVLMEDCVGEIAVYGPRSGFSFMGCANGGLCR